MNPDCLRPHVSDLLQALVCCFKDDSWPVRDGMSDSDVPKILFNQMFETYILKFDLAVFKHVLFLLGEFCS